MSQGSRSSQPLSVGNVVSTGFQLYKKNSKQYLGIALAAIGWTLLPILVLIAFILIAGIVSASNQSLSQSLSSALGIVALGIIVTIVVAVFCVRNYYKNTALISRLAFSELSQQPESIIAARRFVNSRQWSFLLNQILVGLIALGIVSTTYFVLRTLGAILFAVVRGGNSAVVVVFGLLFVVSVVAVIVFAFWFAAHLFGAEVALAVEVQSSAADSIGRFWNLTKGNVWRIVGVILVAVLLTAPIVVFSRLVSYILQNVAAGLPTPTDFSSLMFAGIIYFAGIGISLLLNVLVLPFWQVTKAVTYLDLQNRREGLNLRLRDS